MNQSAMPGEPGREPEHRTGTASVLLEAAREMFARHGYDGASIRAITAEAGANLGAVTYHFGTKRELYEAVLGTVLDPLRARVEAAAEDDGSCLDRVAAIVRCVFRHLAENPDMPHLLLQEIAAGKPPPAPVARTLPHLLGTFAGVIVEGQRRKEIREGDPRLLALSCVAQPIHLTLVRPWAGKLVDVHMEDVPERERVVEHAVAFARAGLAAGPHAFPSPRDGSAS